VWGKRNADRCLVRKSEGKGALGSHRCRWEEKVKMDLKEYGREGMDWIVLAHDRAKGRLL
jgi:hypothetical protein